MQVLILTIILHAPWSHSLKEKRSEVKSLLSQLRNAFNVSASEIDTRDLHQVITIGVSAIVLDRAQGDGLAEQVVRFVESHTEASITKVKQEYLL